MSAAMKTVTYVRGADRMVVAAGLSDGALFVRFADGREGWIPLTSLHLPGRPCDVRLPDPYVIELVLEDGRVEEIPWDCARHFADPGYRNRVERAAERGRKAFGHRLKRLREEAGLTQEELARRSGLHRVTVARLERGSSSPGCATLEALARGLGVPLPALLVSQAEPPHG
jgi:DNA-binding XRE family transcriptional regulator